MSGAALPVSAVPARRGYRLALEGARDMTPMVLGVLPFAIAIGAAISTSSLTAAQGLASGPVILAGSAQLAAVQMLDAGTATVVVIVSALVINARILLYSMAIAPWFRDQPLRRRLLLALPIVDQMHFTVTPRFQRGDLDSSERVAYYAGAAAWLCGAWLATQALAIGIGARLPELFGGFEVLHSTTFRITRDSDIELLEQESDDMLRLIEERLKARQRGDAVRLEVAVDADESMVQKIVAEESLRESADHAPDAYSEVYRIPGPLDLTGMDQGLAVETHLAALPALGQEPVGVLHVVVDAVEDGDARGPGGEHGQAQTGQQGPATWDVLGVQLLDEVVGAHHQHGQPVGGRGDVDASSTGPFGAYGSG